MQKEYLNVILLINLLLVRGAHCSCSFADKCQLRVNEYEQTEYLLCAGFGSFAELGPPCGQFTNITKYVLHPDRPLILDSSLDIIALNKLILTDNQSPNATLLASFKNLIGIDLDLFERVNSTHEKWNIDYRIGNSALEFYYENRRLDFCGPNLTSRKSRPIFSVLDSLGLGSNMRYPSKICPFVFENANLDTLSISGIGFL
jgi:hypothetical protein